MIIYHQITDLVEYLADGLGCDVECHIFEDGSGELVPSSVSAEVIPFADESELQDLIDRANA